jgi:ABC-type Fe3+/spermidine/putrescine transport system ATPase subunit
MAANMIHQGIGYPLQRSKDKLWEQLEWERAQLHITIGLEWLRITQGEALKLQKENLEMADGKTNRKTDR